MVDRTYNFMRYMMDGAEEMRRSTIASREKLWFMFGTLPKDISGYIPGDDLFGEYDIKKESKHEYYHNNASGVIIGDTLVQYDKPGSFLLGYLAAVGGVSLETVLSDTNLYQWASDGLTSGKSYSAEDEHIDQQYITAGYDYYWDNYGVISSRTLGAAFKKVRDNNPSTIVPRF